MQETKLLYLDCISGVSGDMFVGALCDLGVPADFLTRQLDVLGLGGEVHVHCSRESRQGIEGARFLVHVHQHGDHTHVHEDHHGHHQGHAHGRSFGAISELISGSGLSGFVKERSIAVFRRVAEAEGRIHGQPPESVTFHEVGAADSIADIVLACAALEYLGKPRVACSKLFDGKGFVTCAHGRFPIPAPATLEILKGIPFHQIDEDFEFVTPTGAALVAEFAESFGPMPAICVDRIGYGIGSRNHANRPNLLRALLSSPESLPHCDEVVELVANLDDMTPELLAGACESLLAAGALDVAVVAALMKKGRSGHLLIVLSPPGKAPELRDKILRETSTFGVREQRLQRTTLDRDFSSVSTPYGAIQIKRGFLNGALLRMTPEYESCKQAAERAGVPLAEVYRSALAASALKSVLPPENRHGQLS